MRSTSPTVLFVRQPGADVENTAAWQWISANDGLRHQATTVERLLEGAEAWAEGDVLWWHALSKPPEGQAKRLSSNLRAFLQRGRGVFLTLAPCALLGDLGFESSPPGVLNTGTWDGPVGDNVFYGLMGDRGLPIFQEFFGGVYLWQPQRGDPCHEVGYPPGAFPSEGCVVAVRRVHIGIEPEWKLAMEYAFCGGRLLAIGAYLFFACRSPRFRPHLERFVSGCLRHLAGPVDAAARHTYWIPKEVGVRPSEHPFSAVPSLRSGPIPTARSGLELTSPRGQNAPFDLAGRRLLLLGRERGPIREIWVHPFRIWQNLELRFQVNDGEHLEWRDETIDEVRVRPEAVVRQGHVGDVRIREILVVSPVLPVVLIGLEADRKIRLSVAAESDFRLMWPYDPGRLGALFYQFPTEMNGVVVHDASSRFAAFLGFSRSVRDWQSADTSVPEASRLRVVAELVLDPDRPLVLLLGGGSDGVDAALDAWRHLAVDPWELLEQAAACFSPGSGGLRFECSDQVFSEAIQWSLTKTLPFFVETPGLGSGWQAGYAPTGPGWLSGRPGYAWYFGRDSVWTSLAMLAAGEFELVRAALQMLGDYQEFTGKIFHELTTSGAVHYDAADSTPLYLILMARYLEWSGDLEFVRSQWGRILRALEFCFSTDRDGDGLIENTGIGHGWVEGGKLAGAHVTLELAGMWAAALEGTAVLAEAVGEASLVAKTRQAADRVRRVLDTDFWNEAGGFFFYAKQGDGSFRPKRTTLAAVPILLGVTSPEKAGVVLKELARPAYSADWGVRLIAADDPDYDPDAYHQGSVWPLFTGWLSLAEYLQQRPTQAFAHLYGTVWSFHDDAKGCIEEVLHGDVYRPAGVCPHQAWSETMLLQPTLEGLIGLRANALQRRLCLAPQWPPHWSWARLRNLRLGQSRFSVRFERWGSQWRYQFENRGEPFDVELDLRLPATAILAEVFVDGESVAVQSGSAVVFELKERRDVRLTVPRYLAVVPPVFRPRSLQPSRGFRIIDEKFDGRRFEIHCQGQPGTSASLRLVLWGYEIAACSGGTIHGDGEHRRIRFRFPESEADASHIVVLDVKPC